MYVLTTSKDRQSICTKKHGFSDILYTSKQNFTDADLKSHLARDAKIYLKWILKFNNVVKRLQNKTK